MDGSDARKGRFERHATLFVFVTVFLDAVGIGIIVPVTPDLLQELSGLSLDEAAIWGGYLTFVYALMQFLFGPFVGNLSDSFGRRPVLLVSLAALAVDYVIMGFAHSLWLLFLGRMLAGIAGATYSTANAFVADVSPADQRAQNFGLLGAGFGLGFVVGPVIGGLAGELGVRAPFFVAAALAALNAIYGLVVLPESLPVSKRRPFSLLRANPLGATRQIGRMPGLSWFFLAMFLFNIAHYVYPAVWAFYTREAFSWGAAEVGISLAVVGVGFVIVQGWLIRLMLPKAGEVNTAVAGFGFSIAGLAVLAFVTQGWMVYVLMPVIALGAVITPAITAVMANRVSDDVQGELQGVLSSIAGITMIISPLVMTQLFGYFAGEDAPVYFPGAPFLAAALLMSLALVPFFAGLKRSAPVG